VGDDYVLLPKMMFFAQEMIEISRIDIGTVASGLFRELHFYIHFHFSSM